MARVAVIGSGYAGLASACRLARLGHRVDLLERAPALGGALRSVEHEGFAWDGAVSTVLLPAVVRDLFRKTGRPLERELDLVPVPVLREHHFADGTTLSLPGASRTAQRRAFDTLAPGLGSAWLAHVDSYAPTWEILRRGYLEQPWDALGSTPREDAVRAVLASRETLQHRIRRGLRDERLVAVAAHPFVLDGHRPRAVPAWAGVQAWLEQRFGGWRFVGGTSALLQALETRLVTRGVAVHRGVEAIDLLLRGGRVVGVATPGGALEADAVVCAVDPRRLAALARHVRSTRSAPPPTVVHLGLADDDSPPDHSTPAAELVLHGDPLLVLRTGAEAPAGRSTRTLLARGDHSRDLLEVLARRGTDLRERVLTRVEQSPEELVEGWGGSPLGLRWQGRATARRRLGPRTPVRGVYAAGAHAVPGSGLAFVGLSAALVAQAVQQDLAGSSAAADEPSAR